jgi:hypothetical protein
VVAALIGAGDDKAKASTYFSMRRLVLDESGADFKRLSIS